MQFEQQESLIEVKGQIESNQVSIDTANINFIVTILSSNLYSNPIQSFIRETVSNAWDSHVEAGITDPVILELGTDTEGQHFCKIQDFGVGLSPERFDKIYKNIGSSTKRQDNTQIGGFGIGRFSALSYSDVVHITSNYDGIEYKYMMYKEGNSVSIDLINKMQTDNPNGLSVQVPVKASDIGSFIKAISVQLPYFENLYVDASNLKWSNYYGQYDISSIKKFNNLLIKRFNNFYVTSLETETYSEDKISVLLGKVKYPLRLNSLKKIYPDDVKNFPISLVFNIGDLEVTPNREEILYTDSNIAKIEKVLDASIAELKELVRLETEKDCTTPQQYYDAIKDTYKLILLEHPETGIRYIDFKKGNVKSTTLNGKSYDEKLFRLHFDYIFTRNFITFSKVVRNGKIESSSNYHTDKLSINTIKSSLDKTYVCRYTDLDNYAKAYIREKFQNDSKLINPIRSLKSHYKSLKDEIKDYAIGKGNYKITFTFDEDIFRVITKYFYNNLKKLKTFSNSSVPKSFIDNKKVEAKAKKNLIAKNQVDWKQNMNLYPLRLSDRGAGVVSDTTLHSLEEIGKSYKNFVLYADKNSEKFRLFYKIELDRCTKEKLSCVEVAPTKAKLLVNLPNFVKFEDFMKNPKKYRLLRNIATAKWVNNQVPKLKELSKINNLDVISPELAKTVKDLYDFQQEYLSLGAYRSKEENLLIDEIYEICKDQNQYNFNIVGLVNANKKLLNNAEFLTDFSVNEMYTSSGSIPTKQINNIIDYIMARKLFIPNRETLKSFREYQQQKQNPINESN